MGNGVKTEVGVNRLRIQAAALKMELIESIHESSIFADRTREINFSDSQLDLCDGGRRWLALGRVFRKDDCDHSWSHRAIRDWRPRFLGLFINMEPRKRQATASPLY